MTTITARYDGNVLVPTEPVDLPLNEDVQLVVLHPASPNKNRRAGSERAAAIRRWAAADPPAPLVLDDSRDSIYSDRSP